MITIDSDGFWPLKVTAELLQLDKRARDFNFVLRAYLHDSLVEEVFIQASLLDAAKQAVLLHSKWFLREPIPEGSS